MAEKAQVGSFDRIDGSWGASPVIETTVEVVDMTLKSLQGLLLLSCSPRVRLRQQRPLLWTMLASVFA